MGNRTYSKLMQAEYKKAAQGAGRNPERRKDYLLRLRFGLTLKEYMQLLEKQNYSCAICWRPFDLAGSKKNIAPQVDHGHSDGKVRGLLCKRCNLALGHLGDDPRILESAAAYLRQYSED